MKKLSTIILALLLIQLASALDYGTVVTNPLPAITVDFSEPVSITSSKLMNLNTNKLYDVDITTRMPNETIRFKPSESTGFLQNGLYSLQIHFMGAKSLQNNSNFITFNVTIQYMDINIIQPRLGIANHSGFNLTIETKRLAVCSYDLSPTTFTSKMWTFDQQTASTTHTLKNVGAGITKPDLSDDSGNYDNYAKDIYLSCVEPTGKVSLTSFSIGYDTSVPSISLQASPKNVTDYLEARTNLSVNSNDKVICYYNGNKFSDFDENNAQDYSYNPYVIIDYDSVRNEPYPDKVQPHKFNYSITCINLAGLISKQENYEVIVDFDETFDIVLLSPSQFTKLAYINFSVRTTMTTIDGCYYGTTSPVNQMATSDHKNYYTILPNLPEGTHTYNVECHTNFGNNSKAFSFTVDRTAPSKVDIKAENASCSFRVFNAEFNATDNRSGIAEYNYSILHGTDVLKAGTAKSRIAAVSKYEDGERYTLRVNAVDRAGNIGPAAEFGFTALNATTNVVCDKKKPQGKATAVQQDDKTLVNVSCSDSESGCTSKFRYGVFVNNSVNKTCNLTTDESYGNKIPLFQSSLFCYAVFDKNNNNYSRTEYFTAKNYPDYCSDRIKNEDETDVDCGGSCPPCALPGKDCNEDKDCDNAKCFNSTCQNPGCSDGLQNGDESDVDCGVTCPSMCAVGKKCSSNDYCVSRYCNLDLICEASSCTDGLQNGDESDKDCGSICPKCDDGKSCVVGEDCKSGTCDSGICSSSTQTPAACISSDDCNYGLICESGSCVEPTEIPTEEGRKLMPLIMLILGIVALGGGLGYLFYSRYSGKQASSEPSGFDFSQVIPQEQKPAAAQPQIRKENPKVKYMRDRAAKQRDALRKKMRQSVFDNFDNKRAAPKETPAEEPKPAAAQPKPAANKQAAEAKPQLVQKPKLEEKKAESAEKKPEQKKPDKKQQKKEEKPLKKEPPAEKKQDAFEELDDLIKNA